MSDYYLSLDQGMAMAALGNALGGDVLRRAFATQRTERALRPRDRRRGVRRDPARLHHHRHARPRPAARHAGADVICGLGGDDRIDGGGGADAIFGDAGSDRLEGGAGADSLYGDEGDDDLSGGRGDDVVSGGPGADRLAGETEEQG